MYARYLGPLPWHDPLQEVLRRPRERYAIGLVSDAQWVFTEPELTLTGLRDLVGVRRAGLRCILSRPSANGTGERSDAVINQYTDLEGAVESLQPLDG